MTRHSNSTLGSLLAPAALLALALPAIAQPVARVAPAHKYAWAENVGFMNFADADQHDGATGVRVQGSYLTGQIWAENIGWISLGNGAGPYSNATGPTSGVNYNHVSGALTGYAWSENAGWINFNGGALATPANPARVDFASGAGRLRGFAWGENIGWINLNDVNHYVGLNCAADVDADGTVDLNDFFAFFNCWDVSGSCAEMDGNPGIDLGDFFAFFDAFDNGC